MNNIQINDPDFSLICDKIREYSQIIFHGDNNEIGLFEQVSNLNKIIYTTPITKDLLDSINDYSDFTNESFSTQFDNMNALNAEKLKMAGFIYELYEIKKELLSLLVKEPINDTFTCTIM